MESIFLISLTQNTSDLHLSSGESIIIRKNGLLSRVDGSTLSHEQLEKKLLSLLTPKQIQKLQHHHQLDFAYNDQRFGRFRGNIFYQKRGISASFRVIRKVIPTLEEICAPSVFKSLIQKKSGLILITGATGSGKSTTLASLLEFINQHEAKHIITLEDPIEFIYQNKQSLIQQREIGEHCHCFLDGLNAILRQDPDIIMIGELRNRETIEAALQAAETGHIVFATLHTNSAISTINRIIDVFPDESKNIIRTQLAQSLQAIISQQLMTSSEGGRKALFEVLINIPAVSNLIQEGKTKQIISIMQSGAQYGMQLM